MATSLKFTDNFERFTRIVGAIREKLPAYRYSFLDNSKFQELLRKDIAAGNRTYVQEILFRAHLAALSAILRNHRWMHGMDAAMKYPNYFSFCACLRGLVEAASDGHDALHHVMATLAEHFASLRRALKGEFSEAIVLFEPLEEILIHYSHGRKIGKGTNAPASHRAKTMQEYLQTIEEPGSNAVRNLYAELCEVTHPAAATVHIFGKPDPDKDGDVSFQEPEDMAFIVGLLQRHDAVFVPLFQKSFNAALLSLFVINRFDDSRIFTPGAENIDFSRVPAFAEIEEKILASK